MKMSVIALTLYGLLNLCAKVVQQLQCLSNGYLISLNSENGKIHFNSKAKLKKCTFLTTLSDNLRSSTTLKTALHALGCPCS